MSDEILMNNLFQQRDDLAEDNRRLRERIKRLEEELERTKQDRNAIAKNTREPLLLKLDHAAERIKRLEEVGDELSDCADQIGWTSCESSQWIKKAENAVKEWRKAKEVKP